MSEFDNEIREVEGENKNKVRRLMIASARADRVTNKSDDEELAIAALCISSERSRFVISKKNGGFYMLAAMLDVRGVSAMYPTGIPDIASVLPGAGLPSLQEIYDQSRPCTMMDEIMRDIKKISMGGIN